MTDARLWLSADDNKEIGMNGTDWMGGILGLMFEVKGLMNDRKKYSMRLAMRSKILSNNINDKLLSKQK